MTCHNCLIQAKKFGKHRNGLQRFRCNQCRKTFTEDHATPLDEMRLPLPAAETILKLLVEGVSIRSIERITGVHRDTIMRLLALAGERYERLFEKRVKGISPNYAQCDEIWGFVGMKEKHKQKAMIEDYAMGDAYTFVGIDAETKLILCWELGKRDMETTIPFIDRLRTVTDGSRFQLTTDAYGTYPPVVEACFGANIDYAQLVKTYSLPSEAKRAEARYSPGHVTGTIQRPLVGHPKLSKISTSYIERQNLTMRMCIRRLTRLTNGYSKKWENLKAAIALHFAWYNFIRVHQTIKTTPAVKAGLTDHVWTLREMLMA